MGYEGMHLKFERVLRTAIRRGSFKIDCANLTDAKRMRVGFYNFARYMDKIVKGGGRKDYEYWERMKELREIYGKLIFRCYRTGTLEIGLRFQGDLETGELLDDALMMGEEDKRPTHGELLRELEEVEEEKGIRDMLREELDK